MKTIAPAAMAAIEAGTAIVGGAVKITPLPPTYTYETVTVVDVDAVANGTGDSSNGPTVGVDLSGLDAGDVFRITLFSGGTFVAWSYEVGTPNRWVNEFDVIPGGVIADSFRLSQAGTTPSSGTHYPNGYATAADAHAAFGTQFITGATDYCFYILDTATGGGDGTFNNSGGVSVLVERRLLAGGAAADSIRLWSGYGTITIDGEDYEGIGAHGLAQQNAGAVGGVAQGLTLGLSGIDPVALELLDGQEIKGASVVLYRLIFANDAKTMLDAHVFDRGRVDVPSSDETIGGTAGISVAVESAARGLGRNLSRMRADSDQRLIDPHDGYFARTAAAPFISLYWGGRKPTHFGGDATMGM